MKRRLAALLMAVMFMLALAAPAFAGHSDEEPHPRPAAPPSQSPGQPSPVPGQADPALEESQGFDVETGPFGRRPGF
jgi:hypothetical protein